MRSLITVVVGMALTAALWSGGTGPAFGQGQCNQPFAPGNSLGPVRIGMPVDAVQRWYGQPRSVENRSLQGHQWTHLLFAGLDVLARDNAIIALNLPQVGGVPIQSTCGTPLAGAFSLPVGYVQQSYGPPSSTFVANGLQYWLYNALGMLLTLPIGSGFFQGLTVYPVGQACVILPVVWSAFGTFGHFVLNRGTIDTTCAIGAGDHER